MTRRLTQVLIALAATSTLFLAPPANASSNLHVEVEWIYPWPGGTVHYDAFGCRFSVDMLSTMEMNAPAGGSWGFYHQSGSCPGLRARAHVNHVPVTSWIPHNSTNRRFEGYGQPRIEIVWDRTSTQVERAWIDLHYVRSYTAK